MKRIGDDTKRQIVRTGLAIATVALVWPPVLLGQGTILTRFSFGTGDAFGDLPDQAKRAVQLRVAEIVAQEGNAQFPFLQWRVDSLGGSDASLSRLDLRFRQRSQTFGGQPCYRIILEYVGLDWEQEIYPMCSALFSPQDTSKLVDDIREIIKRDFNNEDFRGVEHIMNMIVEVPLTNEIVVDSSQGVVVPLEYERLAAAEKSKLRVSFNARDLLDGEEKSGVISLTSPKLVRVERLKGKTALNLEKFDYPPTTTDRFKDMYDRWRELELISAIVSMAEYKKKFNGNIKDTQ